MNIKKILKYIAAVIFVLIGLYLFSVMYDLPLYSNPYRGQLFYKHKSIAPSLSLNEFLFHFKKRCYDKRGRFPCDYQLDEDAYIYTSSTLSSVVPARLINTNIYLEICEMKNDSSQNDLEKCIDILKSNAGSEYLNRFFINILNTHKLKVANLSKYNLFNVSIDGGLNFLYMYPVFGFSISLQDNNCGSDLKCLDDVEVLSLKNTDYSTMMIVDRNGKVIVPDYLYKKMETQ